MTQLRKRSQRSIIHLRESSQSAGVNEIKMRRNTIHSKVDTAVEQALHDLWATFIRDKGCFKTRQFGEQKAR